MIDPDIKKILMSLEGKTIEEISFLYDETQDKIDYIYIFTPDSAYSIEAEDSVYAGLIIKETTKEEIRKQIKFYNMIRGD